MNRISFLLVTALVIFLYSCRKDDAPASQPAQNRIKTYTETVVSDVLGNFSESFNLSYDNNNRITNMVSASNAGNKFVFTYGSTNDFSLDIYNSNAVVIHQDVFLNAQKQMDSTIQMNDEGDTTSEKYLYNGNLLVQTTRYWHQSGIPVIDEVIDYTYDGSQNLIEEDDGSTITTFTYDSVVLNTVNIYPAYFSPAKQLPTRATYNSFGDILVVDHTYIFDAQKRLTSDKAVLSTGDVVTKSYSYY